MALTIPTTEAELTAQLEAARKEEKAKLYSQIETMQKTLDDLKTKAESAAAIAAEKKALEDQLAKSKQDLDSLNKSLSEGNKFDPTKLAEEVATKTRQAVTAEFQTKLDEMQSKLATESEQAKQFRLAAFRTAEIAKYGGPSNVIESMITGDTEAAIAASTKAAADAFKAIYEKGKADAKGGASTPPPVPGVAGGGSGTVTDPELAKVKGMSMEEYKKSRQSILSKASEHMAPPSLGGR